VSDVVGVVSTDPSAPRSASMFE